ncbi:MAG: hypothetical protein KBG15_03980 [Kofleriaceae bacterium]|nr:hypothetical protein [Kofleriaceae bacterium]
MTVPTAYVRRWNRKFRDEAAAAQDSSIIVTLQSKNRLAMFGTWLRSELDRELVDAFGER